jgi:hypothetical protein
MEKLNLIRPVVFKKITWSNFDRTGYSNSQQKEASLNAKIKLNKLNKINN